MSIFIVSAQGVFAFVLFQINVRLSETLSLKSFPKVEFHSYNIINAGYAVKTPATESNLLTYKGKNYSAFSFLDSIANATNCSAAKKNGPAVFPISC